MPTWPHASYPKMAESPSQWRLDLDAQRRVDRLDWVVTEKLHGANYTLATDGREVRAAKRKAWLDAHEDFFGHARLRPVLAPRVQAVFAALRTEDPDIARLDVCGELFGGGYPHPDVAEIEGLRPVQTGVYYTPDLDFCVFDLRVWTSDGRTRFLGWDDLVRVCEGAGLAAPPPLAAGALADALALDVEALAPGWPARAGLPPLPDNLAEGVVVRARDEHVLPTPRGPRRAMFKRKAERFAEDRYHAAAKPASASGPDVASYALDWLRWRIDELVTPARVDAAVSKIGRPDTPAARAEIAGLVRDEVRDVLRQDHAPEWAALTPDARATVEARLDERVRDAVSERGGRDRE